MVHTQACSFCLRGISVTIIELSGEKLSFRDPETTQTKKKRRKKKERKKGWRPLRFTGWISLKIHNTLSRISFSYIILINTLSSFRYFIIFSTLIVVKFKDLCEIIFHNIEWGDFVHQTFFFFKHTYAVSLSLTHTHTNHILWKSCCFENSLFSANFLYIFASKSKPLCGSGPNPFSST